MVPAQLCCGGETAGRAILRLAVMLSLCAMAGCAARSSGEAEEAFSAVIAVSSDVDLRLEVLVVHDGSTSHPRLVLRLANYSGEDVLFMAPSYGARSFVYSASSGSWIELQDRCLPGDTRPDLLEPYGQQGADWASVVSVYPSIPPDMDVATVRVLVTGVIQRNDEPTDEEVGAFVDVDLDG
jgi:hypothetical protein